VNDLPPVSSEMLERAIGDEAGSPALIRSATRRGIIAMLVASSAIPVLREDVLAGRAGKPIPAGAGAPVMRSSSEKEKASYGDIQKLGWSWDWIKHGFNAEFHQRPDHVHLNDQKSGGSTASITEQYGHYFYKWIGQARFTEKNRSEPRGRVVGSQWVRNYGDEEVTTTLTISGTFTESVSIATKTKLGTKVSMKGKIAGAEVGWEGSIEYESGTTTTKTESYSMTSSIQVRVPARSKRRVDLMVYFTEGGYKFEQPIKFSGWFGAQFSPRVQGHFFWFMSAHDCLSRSPHWKPNGLEDVILGEVKVGFASDTEAVVGRAEPV